PVERLLDAAAGRAVVLVVDPGPLQELLLLDLPKEFRLRHEGVAVAIDLTRARCPGRVRHRVLQPGGQLEQAPQNRILPHSAWTGDHDQEPLLGLGHLITAFYVGPANSTPIRSLPAVQPPRSSISRFVGDGA